MTSQLQMVQPKPPASWPLFRALVGVGLISGLSIVSAYQLTLPIIERKRAEALERAIFQVLPEARSSTTFLLKDGGGFEPLAGDGRGLALVYAGYDEQDRLVGLAIEASRMGYQDVIRVLYGYSFEDEAIVGVRVLESKETPGLGDKIETDPAFLANFRRLDVTLAGDGQALANPIVPVKRGQKEQAWQVDGITGATISSKAIANMLNDSAAYWIPRVRGGRDDFARAVDGGAP